MPTVRTDIPWAEIERRIRRRETYASVAKEMAERGVKVSKQAIHKRATKEGWRTGKPSKDVQATAETIVKRRGEPQENGQDLLLPGSNGKGTAERVGILLQSLRDGLGVGIATKRAGLCRDRLSAWRKANPDFDAACDQMQAEYVEEHLGHLNDASKRGVAQASQYILERHPLSKEQFGQHRGSGQGRIQVIINVPRAAPAAVESMEAVMIDGEAEDLSKGNGGDGVSGPAQSSR